MKQLHWPVIYVFVNIVKCICQNGNWYLCKPELCHHHSSSSSSCSGVRGLEGMNSCIGLLCWGKAVAGPRTALQWRDSSAQRLPRRAQWQTRPGRARSDGT